MKTGLIPPIAELPTFGKNDFHLTLSHIKDARYWSHYIAEKVDRAYVVLDNGAHENKAGLAPGTLLHQAAAIGANEMVAPDVLFKGEETVARTSKALTAWATFHRDRFEDLNPNIMLVPQGEDPQAWRTCFVSLITLYDRFHARDSKAFKPPVIGISKDYEMWEGGIPRLLKDVVIPSGLDIHLLGWGRELWTLGEMAQRWPQIRSTDSAKPFVYALNDIELNIRDDVPPYPRRTSDYFASVFTESQRQIAQHNVAVFRALACS